MTEQTHQKLHLAKEELDVALELFMTGRSHICALVLGGTAEDVFAKILVARGVKPSIEQQQCVIVPVEDYLRANSSSWHRFIGQKNEIHQAARNAGADAGATLAGDLEDAALWMLVRAYDNYKRLGLQPTPKVQEFDRWLKEGLAARAMH
jgi:hypothetical protein